MRPVCLRLSEELLLNLAKKAADMGVPLSSYMRAVLSNAAPLTVHTLKKGPRDAATEVVS